MWVDLGEGGFKLYGNLPVPWWYTSDTDSVFANYYILKLSFKVPEFLEICYRSKGIKWSTTIVLPEISINFHGTC